MERLESEGMNNLEPNNENALRELVLDRIERFGIKPNENLGQHFLIDKSAIDLLSQSVSPGSTVVEVGPGVGQLTESLAEKAAEVISIEIDRRYEPILMQISKEHPNVRVVYGDALAFKYQDLIYKRGRDTEIQIVASLPFHITEPFLHKIAGLPIEIATLVVGKRLMYAIRASDEESADFGQLSLLAQTFFDVEVLSTLEKQKFFPVPRTDSAIIRLTPKEEHEFRSNKRDFLLRRLFLTAKKSPLVKNALKEGLIEFAQVSEIGTLSKKEHNRRLRSLTRADSKRMVAEYNYYGEVRSESSRLRKTGTGQLTQNQAREIIEKMGLPKTILDKPFEQLNNNELGILSRALR